MGTRYEVSWLLAIFCFMNLMTVSADNGAKCSTPDPTDLRCSGDGFISVKSLSLVAPPHHVTSIDTRGRILPHRFLPRLGDAFPNLKTVKVQGCECDKIVPYLDGLSFTVEHTCDEELYQYRQKVALLSHSLKQTAVVIQQPAKSLPSSTDVAATTVGYDTLRHGNDKNSSMEPVNVQIRTRTAVLDDLEPENGAGAGMPADSSILEGVTGNVSSNGIRSDSPSQGRGLVHDKPRDGSITPRASSQEDSDNHHLVNLLVALLIPTALTVSITVGCSCMCMVRKHQGKSMIPGWLKCRCFFRLCGRLGFRGRGTAPPATPARAPRRGLPLALRRILSPGSVSARAILPDGDASYSLRPQTPRPDFSGMQANESLASYNRRNRRRSIRPACLDTPSSDDEKSNDGRSGEPVNTKPAKIKEEPSHIEEKPVKEQPAEPQAEDKVIDEKDVKCENAEVKVNVELKHEAEENGEVKVKIEPKDEAESKDLTGLKQGDLDRKPSDADQGDSSKLNDACISTYAGAEGCDSIVAIKESANRDPSCVSSVLPEADMPKNLGKVAVQNRKPTGVKPVSVKKVFWKP